MKNKHLSFLSLGSNFGNREKQLADACNALSKSPFIDLEVSSDIYQSPPWHSLGNSYYNQCLGIYTSLSPFELMESLGKTETMLGRERNYPKSIRNIDIDIIIYENISLNSRRLILPHPMSRRRPFVILPLKEIQSLKQYKILDDFLKAVELNPDNDHNIIKLNKKGGLHG